MLRKKKKKKKLRFKFKKFTVFVLLLDLLCIGVLVLIHTDKFMNFFITTAMTTKSHAYLARTLYDEDTINRILARNYVEETDEDINLDDISINGEDMFTKKYSSKYERELFKKDPGNDVYKIIRLEEKSFKGYVIGVYDPRDVELAVSSRLGVMGESVNTMVKNNNALVGINGGGFRDVDGWGNGSFPHGNIIEDGKLVWENNRGSGELIGFTKDHKLFLTSETPQQAIADGMMDAVEFGPNLIVNGKPLTVHGDGGWGIAPRTVIGQRKDGVVIMLSIEGRLPGYSIGATMNDLITILKRYKVYNAANLDGGASATMSVEGELFNRPSAGGEYGGRTVSNAWIVTNKLNKPAKAPVKNY
ncbi:MAG: phosphodiester glycosidase family protein [Bacilli bacterium]|nr:phosphodiester glycosidase family protein [Bacilli bacterium]